LEIERLRATLPEDIHDNFMLDRYLDQMTLYTGTVIGCDEVSSRNSMFLEDTNGLNTVLEFQQLEQHDQLTSEHYEYVATRAERLNEASRLVNHEARQIDNKTLLDVGADDDAASQDGIFVDALSELGTVQEAQQLDQDDQLASEHQEHMATRTERTDEASGLVNYETRQIDDGTLSLEEDQASGTIAGIGPEESADIGTNAGVPASALSKYILREEVLPSTTTLYYSNFGGFLTYTKPWDHCFGKLQNCHVRTFKSTLQKALDAGLKLRYSSSAQQVRLAIVLTSFRPTWSSDSKIKRPEWLSANGVRLYSLTENISRSLGIRNEDVFQKIVLVVHYSCGFRLENFKDLWPSTEGNLPFKAQLTMLEVRMLHPSLPCPSTDY
jgi:hypothetical protein